MMISNPSTLNGSGESILAKQNGKAPDTTTNNDEEEEDDHTHIDQISSLKQKLLVSGLVSSKLKRSPSAEPEPAKKIKPDEDSADKKRRALIRLRQLENKLRNEETKYVVLKRMYYSQKSNAHRVANGQPTKAQHKPGQIKPPIGKAVAGRAAQLAGSRPPTTPVHNSASATSLQHKQHRVSNNSSPLLKNPSPSSAFSPVAEPKKPNAHTHALVNQLVRKEFEKSLNQLEFPPKSAQHHQLFQDIYFLPNANSPDFLMCLGLEEVVRCVQEHLSNKQQYKELKERKELNATDQDDKEKASSQTEVRYEYPYVCAQCSTDWTPVWRTDRNGVVLCEKCLKQLEKKQIKQEQMAKLKQLFSKAHKDKEMFEKQVLSEQSSAAAVKAAQSTPKPVAQQAVHASSRPAHSTPVHAGQKMAPVSGRPSPLQSSHRPSPTGAKTPGSAPRPAQQNARSVPSVQSMPKTNSGKEQQQQRQRGSAGGANTNAYAQSSVKSAASASSSSLNNLNSQFNFSNLPHAVAFAALAQHQQQQQQQQQQQAALLQLLQNQPQSSLFNLPNLSSSTATLNYLNMLSSSAANLNGKQWKNS